MPPKERDRRAASGFTLVEIMIVLAIASLLMIIVFPRLVRAPAKAYMSDAVSGLAAVAAQVESKCVASAGTFPANIANFVTSYPSGYTTVASNGVCSNYNVTFVNGGNTALPNICIQRQSAGIMIYGAVNGGTYKSDDVPAKVVLAACP